MGIADGLLATEHTEISEIFLRNSVVSVTESFELDETPTS
jgi:hypothetical protein